jgi:hypothetical protein
VCSRAPLSIGDSNILGSSKKSRTLISKPKVRNHDTTDSVEGSGEWCNDVRSVASDAYEKVKSWGGDRRLD